MFESAEIGHRLDKSEYRREEPKLRQALLKAQYDLLAQAKFPVLILINGVDGAGKGETANLFNEWMDPRHISTHAFGPATEDERDRPEMWRFWRALPAKGRIGILFGSWYSEPILDRVMGKDKRAALAQRLERIRGFEQMLAAEGALIIKLWFHLSNDAQKKRFKSLLASKKTAWRVAPDDWQRFKHYDEFVEVCEDVVRETSTGEAPWHVIEGSNAEYRSLAAGRLLLDALNARLQGGPPKPCAPVAPPEASIDGRNLLNSLDFSAKLERKSYERRLEKAQARLNQLTRERKMRKRALVVVFEGMDAAGKGSTIRRMTQAMDARFYRVVPIAAPTDEERAQPYLWRFWRQLPMRGKAVIFDRSWYGRVLVERVEGFCAEADWMRAYHEINEFEEQIADAGGILAKFWLAVTPQEQLRRFKERERIAYKRFKITAEDWRNRKQWPKYERAVSDMVERTSTTVAPWQVIAANDKLLARINVVERLCERIEALL